MANVRIKSFAAGDDEKDCAEHHETAAAVVQEEIDTMPRIDRGEHAGRTKNLVNPENADREKPQYCDRTEYLSHSCRAT